MPIYRMAITVQAMLAPTNTNPNNQPYKVVTTPKEFELALQDKATFRKIPARNKSVNEANTGSCQQRRIQHVPTV